MSEELEQDEQLVEVLWEDGTVVKCEIYDVVDFEDKTYAVLLPVADSDDEDSDAILMQYVEEGEEGYFKSIEDEEEFNRVCDYIQSIDDEDEDE